MRRIARQLLIPVLISFSLTGVSLAFLYLLRAKDEEDEESVRDNKPAEVKVVRKECKIKRQFVPIVIGRAGTTIQDIEERSKTQIRFKEEDDVSWPERICEIRGRMENIQLAEEMIKNVIENQPVIETYEMYVPEKICARIMRKCGKSLQTIQMSSSAKVIIEKNYASCNPNAERRMIIKGTAEQIASAFSEITEKVQEERAACLKLESCTRSRSPRGKLSPRTSSVSNGTEQDEPRKSLSPSSSSSSLQVGSGFMEVYVSAMESPSQFWIQLIGSGTTGLNKLVSEMTAYYKKKENRDTHVLKNISLGEIVAAKFSVDEQWYRGEVICTGEADRYEIYFVDYGDREFVERNCILELRTDFLSLRLQAIECSLACTRPREKEWSREACDRFFDLARVGQWHVLVAKVEGYKTRTLGCGTSRRKGLPVPCIHLCDENDDTDLNIGAELVKEGLAEPEEPFSSSAACPSLTGSSRTKNVSRFSNVSCAGLRQSSGTASNNLDFAPGIRGDKQEGEKEEIDLTSPDRSGGEIEEIDLVTPERQESRRFLVSERNGGGVWSENRGGYSTKGRNGELKVPKFAKVAPAGYESDLSGDSDVMDLG